MKLNERTVGTIIVLDISGTMTQSDAEVLRSRLATMFAGGCRRIVLDLAELTHLDSAALGGLVASQIRANEIGTKLKLANSAKKVRDLLLVTRLAPVFDSYDSLNAAVASFGDPPGAHS